MICSTPACGKDTTGRLVDICPACWKLLAPEEMLAVATACTSPLWPKDQVAKDVSPGARPGDGALLSYLEARSTTEACAKAAWKRRARAAAKRRAKNPRSWMRG